MSVNTQHPLYIAIAPEYRIVRDCLAGQKSIKSESGGQDKVYLPDFDPPNPGRYRLYKRRALFLEVAAHTVRKLTGAAFREDPEYDLAESIQYLIDDADGIGNDLIQLAKESIYSNTAVGRHVLVADFPPQLLDDEGNPLVVSREDQEQQQRRARIRQYTAESFINWNDDNGRLTMVVLHERQRREQINDGINEMFVHNYDDYYRVYWLDGEGQCRTDYVKLGETVNPEAPLITNFNGDALDYIPAVVLGASCNGPDISKPPALPLCYANIDHYQIYALHKENLAVHGQVTAGISSDTPMEEIKTANGGSINVGAPNGVLLGKNGRFSSLTAPESSSLSKALEDSKQNMVAIGASLIERSGAARTAREAGIDAAEQTSIMLNVVINTSDGIERILDMCENYMSANPRGNNTYRINEDFFDQDVDAQMLGMALNARREGLITTDEFRRIAAGPMQLDINDTAAPFVAEEQPPLAGLEGL